MKVQHDPTFTKQPFFDTPKERTMHKIAIALGTITTMFAWAVCTDFAVAQIVTQRSSADFVSTIDQIEGNVNPTTLSTWTADIGQFDDPGQLVINGNGTLTVSTNTADYDRWANHGGLTGPAWTIEARVRVDQASTGTDPGVFDIVSRDGSTHSPWVFLRADGIGARTNVSPIIYDLFSQDLTDDFHVLRIAADATEGTALWLDGVEIATNWGDDGNFPSAIFLGRNGVDTVDNGTVTIDYIRFDTTGAFAPAPELEAVPEPSAIAIWSLIGIAGGGFVLRRRRARK